MQFHDPEKAQRLAGVLSNLVEQMRRYDWADVPCVVCGEEEKLIDAEIKWGVQMRRCTQCGHLFTSPRMPESAVGELYGSYYWDQYQVAIGSPSLEERNRFDYDNGVTKLQRDILPFRTSGRLLEIGASNGGLVKRALEAGFEAIGLEPSPEICQRARDLHGVEMLEGELLDQHLPAGTFDVIVLHDVLEHMFEPVRDLREMFRILAPGGVVVIETPSTSSLFYAEDGVQWSTISPIEHVHLFNEGNIQRVLEQIGFEILDLYSPNENNWVACAEKPAR